MNKLKIILFSISIISYISISLGQNHLDSLWNKLKKAEHDTTRCNIYLKIGDYFEYKNPDSALFYYDKALKLSEFNNYTQQKAIALTYIGYIYVDEGNFDTAKKYYSKSLNTYQLLMKSPKPKEANIGKKGISICFNNIGNLYNNQGLFDSSIVYFLKSLKIKEELNDKTGIAGCYSNIGNVHYYQRNFDKAMEYYISASKLFEELQNKQGMLMCYNNIGSICTLQKKHNLALDFLQKTLEGSVETGDKMMTASCYNSIGNVYFSQKNYKKALENYLKSLKVKEEIQDKNGIASSYINIGLLNLEICDSLKTENEKKKILNEALNFTLKGFQIADSINALPSKYSASHILFKTYYKKGNFKKAFEFAEQCIELKDSMFSKEKTKAMTEMSTKYESEKKQLEIEKLGKEKELQISENKKQKIIIIFTVSGLTLILIITTLIFRSLRITRKQKKTIEEQKRIVDDTNNLLNQQNEEIRSQRDEIEKQKDHIEVIHKDLTDSINYAERIQRSFMATKSLLDANLNDYFVLFRPKDVVSGDFYWAGKLKNNHFALVTADSTGHGVPGAIMSILNISSIEKAVENGLCEPSEIFNLTRKNIIERLKNDGSTEGGKDGMDASILVFDKDTTTFKYAAANNPIWIIRNNELIELYPDKMPLGKHDKDNVSFTQNEFEFRKGDIIYTMSDGYQDQFGGPKSAIGGKKFLSKNLKQLLIANYRLSMNEQKEILEKTLVDWIGDGEQIDDITIIGIKV